MRLLRLLTLPDRLADRFPPYKIGKGIVLDSLFGRADADEYASRTLPPN